MNKDYLIQLTNNLYRLTLLFPKKEPLRYKMRELADDIFAWGQTSANLTEVRPRQVLENLEILDGFFEIAKAQNWVPILDILRIQEEYNRIRAEIKKIPKRVEPLQRGTGQGQSLKTLKIRQQKILDFLKEKDRLQVWQVKEIFPEVTKRTLRRDFEQLLKQGIIERIGTRNDTFYQLKDRTR